MTPQAPTVSPKLKQFQDEINELCERYQYSLEAQIEYRKNALVPIISVVERLPKPKAAAEVKKSHSKKG